MEIVQNEQNIEYRQRQLECNAKLTLASSFMKHQTSQFLPSNFYSRPQKRSIAVPQRTHLTKLIHQQTKYFTKTPIPSTNKTPYS